VGHRTHRSAVRRPSPGRNRRSVAPARPGAAATAAGATAAGSSSAGAAARVVIVAAATAAATAGGRRRRRDLGGGHLGRKLGGRTGRRGRRGRRRGLLARPGAGRGRLVIVVIVVGRRLLDRGAVGDRRDARRLR